MMQLEVMRLYLKTMKEIYQALEQESLYKAGAEYEEMLDQLAALRAHMMFTKNLIRAMEEVA